MVAQLEVVIPWNGLNKSATILGGRWRGDPVLERAFAYLHLPPGHHADRDGELASMAVKYFGGNIKDGRVKPVMGKMPR